MQLLLGNKHVAYLLLSCFIILSSFYLVRVNYGYSAKPTIQSDELKLHSFYQTWCGIRRLRRDWKRILQPCEGLTRWASTKEGWREPTDPQSSIIVAMDIRPTYEFSRIFIETRTSDNRQKKIGGDSWRVHLKGPSSPSTTVYDHQNGTYEVVFLVIEPGIYTVHAYLEHSLCDGLKEPPDNWFAIGNAQGKYQPHGSLGTDRAYLSKKLQSVQEIAIMEEGNSIEYREAVRALMQNGNSVCKSDCNFLWDGYGRWINDKWYPYQNQEEEEEEGEHEEIKVQIQPNHDGIIWFYGDSVMAQFYSNIKIFGKICFLFTGGCGHTYNWVYQIIGYNTTRAKLENDDKDFDRRRIINEVNDVLRFKPFNKTQSILFVNFGLHFTESSSFSNYKKLIQDFVSIVKNQSIYKGSVIWRTTTALNKHKLGGRQQHSRRFLTQQRVTLFNAYATSQMCEAGIPVLDLFSLTDSYPKGSGIGGYQFDAVHYEHKVFAKAEKRLEHLLKRKLL